MRWPLLASAVLCALAFAAPARAVDREKADALFRDGRSRAQSGDYAGACTSFTESQQLDPSTGTLLNLGDCSEHLGRLVAARNYFQDAIGELGAGDPRMGPAKQRLAALESRLPRLVVSLAKEAPAGTSVACDGRPLSEADLGAPRPLDPGEHTLVVTKPGAPDEHSSFRLAEGEAKTIVVGAPPAPSPAPAAAPTAIPERKRDDGKTPRTIGWIVGGVGVAGLALAGVSGLVLLNEKSTADSGCVNKTNCNADALDAISANKTWIVVNTAAWIVGVAGVAAGAYLILSHPARSATIGVAPVPGGAAVQARLVLP